MPDISEWLTYFSERFVYANIPGDIIFVLIYIPVLVTLTSISRYITGIKTFGIYASMILALAYYYMGFIQGFSITLLVVITSWIVRNILRKAHLHYLSRLSIVYSVVAIVILCFLVGLSYIPVDDPDIRRYLSFSDITFLPIAMIISVTDRFMATYIKKDFMTAAQLTLETLAVAVVGWTIMRWHITSDFIVNNYPWILPLLIIVNVLVGHYAGLRWTEIIRFAQVIRNAASPDTNQKKQ